MVAGGGPMKCGRLSWDEIGAPLVRVSAQPCECTPCRQRADAWFAYGPMHSARTCCSAARRTDVCRAALMRLNMQERRVVCASYDLVSRSRRRINV